MSLLCAMLARSKILQDMSISEGVTTGNHFFSLYCNKTLPTCNIKRSIYLVMVRHILTHFLKLFGKPPL